MLLEAHAALPIGMRVVSGGETLPPDLAARLLASVSEVVNLYGPTETTIWSALARVRRGDAIVLRAPLAAASLRLVDTFHDESWPGSAGEVGIGGRCLAHGYVGNPALTAARFVPDADAHGGRLYRSGDIGRSCADGAIAFLGRADHQTKVRGYRVELGDIEAALRRCPGISDAAAIATGGDRVMLTGFVTLAPGARWDDDETKAYLRTVLPDALVPQQLVVLDALPVTLNQKIDRARLPAMAVPVRSARRVVELFEHVKSMSPDAVQRLLAQQV
jgi:acyl-coenzyme A synthetase/AMP-(fatty) acid ligase